MSKLEVLYEDNHIIVVKKPVNILSQSDITGDIDLLTMVKNYVKEKYNKPGNVYIGLIHRLDRPVCGIMVFARTSKAASRLSEEMRTHQIKKSYLAVTRGIIEKDNDTFVDYLVRDKDGNTMVTDSKHGVQAELSYEVISRNKIKNETLLRINLKTGRHHQIRVQFASRGHSLCGDQRYGKQDKTQIALCSYKLEFIHPVTKEVMHFEIKKPVGKYWNDFEM